MRANILAKATIFVSLTLASTSGALAAATYQMVVFPTAASNYTDEFAVASGRVFDSDYRRPP